MVMHGTRGNLGNLGNHSIHGIYVNLGKERRKRKGHSILQLQEEKEKVNFLSPFSRREREI